MVLGLERNGELRGEERVSDRGQGRGKERWRRRGEQIVKKQGGAERGRRREGV